MSTNFSQLDPVCFEDYVRFRQTGSDTGLVPDVRFGRYTAK